MTEPIDRTPKFDPMPVQPGRVGLRYTILDHRGTLRPMADATWSERLRHAAGASRFLPRVSFSLSTIGLLALVFAGTFAMQEAGSRLAATFGRTAGETPHFVIRALGLFGPLIIIGVLLVAGVLSSAMRIWMPAVARYWLSIGECASCRYDISNIEPSSDGCVVCPECGGAWKINRVA